MAPLFLDVAIRATLIAAATAVVLWTFRIKTAAVRHSAWTVVVIAMLLLPLWSAGGLKVSVPVLPAPVAESATPADVVTLAQRTVDSSTPLSAASGPPADVESRQPINWQLALFAIYVAGAFVLLVRLAIGTLQAHRLRRDALMQAGRATSDRCATPITIGMIAPVVILPPGWQHWPSGKLHAVLTHEHEHVRRHDTLVQWLALFNRAVFWFHPLAWWLERRLATLAEEACDAAVLAAGHSPQDYSAYLLDFARSALREGRRVRNASMAMPGNMLRSRLCKILDGMSIPAVSRSRAAGTIAFCALSSVVFAAGMPSARAAISQAQAESAMQIKFEVVSIKPCEGSGEPAARGGGAGTARSMITPGYSFLACQTVNQLIDMAWGGGSFPTNWLLNTIRVPPGHRPDVAKRVRGGPSWADEERFSLEIRMSGDTTDKTGPARHDVVANAMAPAMRALLEDRFQLKLRKVTEQVPMYAMTVAAGGLKIPQTAKPGEKCWVPLPATSRGAEPVAPPGSEGLPPCNHRMHVGNNGGNKVWQLSYIGLKDFAEILSETVDRYVLDQSGADGRFTFTLEYAPDERTPGDTHDPFARIRRDRGAAPPAAGTGPSIFKAVELLGLKLAPTKGPAEYLQIESVQRPRPDIAAVAASSGKPDAPPDVSGAPARASGPFVAQEADQTQPERTFDVVSIKPCEGLPRALADRRGGVKRIDNSTNRLFLECITLESLANLAYTLNGDFVVNEHIDREVRGGPEWVRSERYTIEAKATGNPTAAVMMGPMLRAVLEDRFQLRVHRETGEIPMYALTVARSGLKIKPIAKGDCVEDEDDKTAAAPTCGTMRSTRRGSVRVWDFGGADLGFLAQSIDADRQILDQTGVKDRFNIHLEYETDEKVLEGVTVFAALEQQLGLKLVSTKGPHQFIVIDRVERPKPNHPLPVG